MALLPLLVGVLPAAAQPRPDDEGRSPPIAPAAPRELLRAMFEAANLAEREQYPLAAKAVQVVLNAPEDFFLDRELRETLKRRAVALVASWPRAGREAYELQFGAAAEALRVDAERSGDADEAARVLQHYWNTAAGRMVVERMAREAFDSGRPLLAALYWDELRATHPGEVDLRAGLREAWAWDRVGLTDRRDQRLASLPREPAAGPLLLGGQTLPGSDPLAVATEWLADHALPQQGPRTVSAAWPELRGDSARNGIALPAGPIGAPAWTQSLLGETIRPPFGANEDGRSALVERILTETEERLTVEDRLAFPAFAPIVDEGVVVARTLTGLVAYDVKSGALRWRSILDDPTFRKLWGQLPQEFKAESDVTPSTSAVTMLSQYLRDRLYRDLLVGTLSTDGTAVYALEASVIVPQPNQPRNARGPIPQLEPTPPANRLVAFELQGGRLLWELGGGETEVLLPLAGHFFLGPPLAWHGKLYCISEVDQELRLLELQPDHAQNKVSLAWSQVLVSPNRPVALAPLRRFSGLTPTSADGLLICPTGCGIVAAVDPVRRALVWGYHYESLEAHTVDARFGIAFRPGRFDPTLRVDRSDDEVTRWIDSAPIFASGSVILTPRDSHELHCLDVATGQLRWKKPREDALYAAGIADGRVIVVGRTRVQALRLTDGEPAWTDAAAIPMPVGRGLLMENRYLLPVDTHEILTLDLGTGRILSRSRLEQHVTAGNLSAANGALIGQSPRGLTAFRPLAELEQDIADRLQRNGRDAAALALRGELRLYRGDEAAGLQDLRQSLAERTDPRTGSLLASRLLDGLRADFPRYRATVDELEGLLSAAESRSEFLRIYAAGLTQAGDRAGAFHQYLKLAQLNDFEDRLERVSADLTARGDRLIRGHLRALARTATADEIAMMNAAVSHLLDDVVAEDQRGKRDRRLLRFFEHLSAINQLRRQLLTQETDPPLSDSERVAVASQLASSTDAAAGQGVAWLARQACDQGRRADALRWIERLSSRFADIPVDGKRTGQAVAAELEQKLANWKPPKGWGERPLAFQRQTRNSQLVRYNPVDVIGPWDPAWKDWSFEVLEYGSTTFHVRDPRGRIQWKVAMPVDSDRNVFRAGPYSVVHHLRMVGNLWVLSLGSYFAVFDVSTADAPPKFRWKRELTSPTDVALAPVQIGQRMGLLPNGRRRLVPYHVNTQEPAGQVIGAAEGVVCYHIGARLTAAELETGRILWSRQNVPRMVEGSLSAETALLLDLERPGARLYRTDDGEELPRRELPPADDWLWFHGDRGLTLRKNGSTAQLELRRLNTDDLGWSLPVDAASRVRVFDDTYVFCLTPNHELSKRRVEDGHVVWQRALTLSEKATFLWIDRFGDMDLIYAGSNNFNLAGRGKQVMGYDLNQAPFAGKVIAVNRESGADVWSAEIGPHALDLVHRPNVPVLPFVCRAINNAPGSPVGARIRFLGTFLDKRTGEVLYETEEAFAPAQYQLELDADQPAVSANFTGWAITFRPEGD